jgi:ABC-type branched-subunit amino acid transport system ATPase component/MFS family permease
VIRRVRSYLLGEGDYLGGEDRRGVTAMFGLNAVDELDNAVFIWVGPTIARAFGKDVGFFGVITVLAIFIAPLIAIPVSRAGDHRSRMPIVLFAAAAWGLFSLLSGLAPIIWIFIAARIGSSFGRTVAYPVQLSLLADFYSPAVRTRALGIHALANNAGQIVGALVGGGLAALFGWRSAFLLIAIPTFATIWLCRRVQEPPRGRFEAVSDAEPLKIRAAFAKLAAIRAVRYQWIAGIWIYGSLIGTTIVLPFFFDHEFGVSTFGVGVIGAVAGLGAMVATLVGSRIGQDRLNVSPSTGVRWFVLVCFGLIGVVVVFALSPTVWVAAPLLFVVSSGFGLLGPLEASLITMAAPPELRATAYAIGQVLGLAGAVFALAIAGIADAAGTRWGLLAAAAIFVRGTFHVRTVGRYIDADVQRLSPDHIGETRRPGVLLETRGVTVSFDGTQVLFGIDLEVGEGEIVALLGTNGAGKSTILNAVCGLVETDDGNIWFDGEPITGEPAERIARRGLVMAPGGRGIFPGLTVAENLRLGAYLIRSDQPLSTRRVREALEVFPALAPLQGQSAGSLSGGQRQMLVLAQAFLLRPKLLLIDELSLGLAPVIVSELLDAVRRLNAEGMAIVLVEQSVNVALTLADRAYFLEKGQVRFCGATADLLERGDLLRSVFLEGAGKR